MKTDFNRMIEEIVQYLNNKTGSSFRPGSVSTVRPIIARINEGYKAEDFRAVIDEKCRQWIGNEPWSRYLRPQTLFGNKFESYLQEAKRRAQKASNGRDTSFRDSKELMG